MRTLLLAAALVLAAHPAFADDTLHPGHAGTTDWTQLLAPVTPQLAAVWIVLGVVALRRRRR
jgi:hypothetical protein